MPMIWSAGEPPIMRALILSPLLLYEVDGGVRDLEETCPASQPAR